MDNNGKQLIRKKKKKMASNHFEAEEHLDISSHGSCYGEVENAARLPHASALPEEGANGERRRQWGRQEAARAEQAWLLLVLLRSVGVGAAGAVDGQGRKRRPDLGRSHRNDGKFRGLAMVGGARPVAERSLSFAGTTGDRGG